MSAPEQPMAPPPKADPKLIYIVDDESMIGEVAQIILRMEGYRCRFFQDPQLALRAVLEDEPKPALLLTDFRMTPLNGMQLIEQSMNRCPELRTILYSGNLSEEMVRQYAIRPDGLLRKPFLPGALLSLVRSTLARAVAVGVGLMPVINLLL